MELLIYLPLFILWIPIGLYLWFTYTQNYWKRQKVPYIPGKLPFGNVKNLMLLTNNVAEEFADFYFDEKTKNEPYIGLTSFHKPILMVKDPELIKRILVKDFNLFVDRHSTSSPYTDGLSNYNLFFVKSPIWKEIRNRVTPVFTSGKMKQLFNLLEVNGEQLATYMSGVKLDQKTNSFNENVKDLCGLYTTDAILSCAFGMNANCVNNPDNEFRKFGKKLVEPSFWRALEFNTFFFLPEIIRLCNFKIFSTEIANLLRTSIEEVMNERIKTGNTRNDLIDVLIQLKEEDKGKAVDKFSVAFQGDVLFAQAAVFFFAGFETTASAISFALYELAMQPELQDRLREEIKDLFVENKGKLTYDAVMNAPYMEMVIKEVLRLYPPLPFLDRICKLPKGEKGLSLEPFGPYEIPNNMPVMIPVYGLHTDPKYFPDPFKFDPERFNEENEPTIPPYTYMPFGLGPRNCIGNRFGLMLTKMGLIYFLKNFKVRPGPNTLKKMILEKNSFLPQAKGGIHLDIVKDPLL